MLWPPDAKNWLIWQDADSGKDWGQEQKGMTEDEMIGWHHQLNGHEFGWTPGVGDGQGCLACCSPCGHKESDMTEWLNWTELKARVQWRRFLMIPLQISVLQGNSQCSHLTRESISGNLGLKPCYRQGLILEKAIIGNGHHGLETKLFLGSSITFLWILVNFRFKVNMHRACKGRWWSQGSFLSWIIFLGFQRK